MTQFPPDLGEVLVRGTCPICSSSSVRRSRVKTRFERALKRFTTLRPFRCKGCGWRGLARASSGPVAPLATLPPLPPRTRLPPEHEAAFDPRPKKRRRKLQPVVRRRLTTVLSFVAVLASALALGYFISTGLF